MTDQQRTGGRVVPRHPKPAIRPLIEAERLIDEAMSQIDEAMKHRSNPRIDAIQLRFNGELMKALRKPERKAASPSEAETLVKHPIDEAFEAAVDVGIGFGRIAPRECFHALKTLCGDRWGGTYADAAFLMAAFVDTCVRLHALGVPDAELKARDLLDSCVTTCLQTEAMPFLSAGIDHAPPAGILAAMLRAGADVFCAQYPALMAAYEG